MKTHEPKLTISYCENPMPDDLQAEKYIIFIKHLVDVFNQVEKDNVKK